MQAIRQFKRPSQLFRGYTALAARNLPFTAMQFPMFEHLKTSIKDYRKKNGTFTGSLTETALTTATSAGSAGSIAALITTPVDVVKTRIMLAAAGESSEDPAKKEVEKARTQGHSLQNLASKKGGTKKSSLSVGREVVAESGIKGLFRGGTMRALWTALGSGLYLGVSCLLLIHSKRSVADFEILKVYESGRTFLGGRHEATTDE